MNSCVSFFAAALAINDKPARDARDAMHSPVFLLV